VLTRRKQGTEYRKEWLSARPLLATCVFLMLSLSIEAAVYYVSTDGDDAADGTTTGTAWRTINASINRITAPDSLQIRGGTYREEITVTNTSGSAETPLVMEAYSNESPVVKGSDIVTSWTYHGNSIWKKTGYTNHPQQVFADGEYLQMIGWPNDYLATNVLGCSPNDYIYIPYGHNCSEANSQHTISINGLAEIFAGSFFYDESTDILYVQLSDNSSPNNHIMEISSRLHTFIARDSAMHVIVRNMHFEHCNTLSSVRAGWPNVVIGPYGTIEQSSIGWSDAYGLSLKSNAKAINCHIHHNGMAGVNMGNCTNFLISGCTISSNNYRDFTLGYTAGIKIIPNAGGVVESNELSGNFCSGVWFDTCHAGHPITVRNNNIHHNAPYPNRDNDDTPRGVKGVFIEFSDNASVYNNLISSNSFVGISLSASCNTRVFNNTIIGTHGNNNTWRGLYAISVGNPQPGYLVYSNYLYNNLVYNNECDFDLVLTANNGSNVFANFSDYNLYFRPHTVPTDYADAGIIFPNSHIALASSGILCSNLQDWISETGWDSNSIATDPALFGIHLTTSSPCINAGISMPWMSASNDYCGEERIIDSIIDVGATELGSLRTAFYASPQTAVIPFCSVFHGTAIATNSSVCWYGWDCNGDGVYDYQGPSCAIITNCYTQASPYTVSLVISNADGSCSTGRIEHCIDARVQEPPENFWIRAFALTNSTIVRWINPPEAGISNQLVQVRWATEDNPADINSGQLLYTGTNQWCLHTNLTPGITYHYTIWTSHDGGSFTNPP
jgi:parallel beta-helix repeat protein